MHLNYPQKPNGLYILSRDNIDDIATQVLNEYMPTVLKDPSPVDIVHLAREEYGLEIKHEFITHDVSVLGMIFFAEDELDILDDVFNKVHMVGEEGTIIIERAITKPDANPRYLFTLAHEVGHWLIHRSFHSPTNQQYDCRTAKTPYIACRSHDIEKAAASYNSCDDDWQEWQANTLAAALLMPKDPFIRACIEVFCTQGYYHRIPYAHEISPQALYQVTSTLAKPFNVSRQAAKIRMNTLGLFCETNRYAG